MTNGGDLTAQDLIDKQNEGFVMIYSKLRRWLLRGWRPLGPVMRHPKET